MDREKKDDGGKDCGGGSSSCSESQSKIQNNKSSGSLPEDVMFNILTRLPADWLHNSARFTCKSWAAMIHRSDFIQTHLLRAKPGIFLQSTRHPYGAHFLEVKDNGEYGVTALRLRFPGRYLNSCDGLILFSQKDTVELHIVNPVTMQTLNVPKVLSSNLDCPPVAIVRVPHTGKFKLFASLVQTQSEVCYSHWHVLRLGKDTSWTRFASEPGDFEFRCTPIYCGGNDLYWITQDHVIVMDVDKETFRKYLLPRKHHEWCTQFFKIENRLASIVFLGAKGYKIHIFDADSGKWRLYHQMGILDDYYNYPRDDDAEEATNFSESFGVWINQELIFKLIIDPPLKASLYSYNVETCEAREIDVIPEGLFNGAFEEGSFDFGLHTISLMSW
ncbi:uncharacterized protein LOC129285028 [Prosopis cineraria]|uniref:uncharacterized protein LOC129285028 n=1 Tax=Prosopis cineraria TaxID=364024 RepID=UPI00240EC0D8|nr:uncharacterized protein LOC129285028 [Prosopis cineraria]XP_054776549.1 uncharacterized protein LOC129285028 [Prosopis cineraria]